MSYYMCSVTQLAVENIGEMTTRLPVARHGLTGLNALTPHEVAMYEGVDRQLGGAAHVCGSTQEMSNRCLVPDAHGNGEQPTQ